MQKPSIDPCLELWDEKTKSKIRLAKQSDLNVLILGPTGTGKSTLAREIHLGSQRSTGPWIHINLATLHEETLESELFGHDKGAFTGAVVKKVGLLEQAEGGTVFLDEIAELPLKYQARLLEFFQNKTVTRLGSVIPTAINARVICATNRNLKREVNAKRFREDLFFRLQGIAIELTPLVESAYDFGELIHSIVETWSRRMGKNIRSIAKDVAETLEHHSWPGNFRELESILQYAIAHSTNAILTLSDLPESFLIKKNQDSASDENGINMAELGTYEIPFSLDYHQTIAEFEKEFLKRAFRRFRGRLNLTSRQIGLSKATLSRRLFAYGITKLYDESLMS